MESADLQGDALDRAHDPAHVIYLALQRSLGPRILGHQQTSERFLAHIMFGLSMCLLALLTKGEATAAINLSSTAWPLPIVAMVVLVVLAIHHISWENKEAEESTGEKQYHFLPRWRPNRTARTDPPLPSRNSIT
ncbi:hypothetical protein V1504DRAFT_463603 [Lipomyces starkeyi]